jgi:hypothetical protein
MWLLVHLLIKVSLELLMLAEQILAIQEYI